jgi:prophage antirepressor-like protein
MNTYGYTLLKPKERRSAEVLEEIDRTIRKDMPGMATPVKIHLGGIVEPITPPKRTKKSKKAKSAKNTTKSSATSTVPYNVRQEKNRQSDTRHTSAGRLRTHHCAHSNIRKRK